MRAFDYEREPEKLLTPEVVRLLTKMHEYKGKQSFLLSLRGGDLVAMRDSARKESAKTTVPKKMRKKAAEEGREQRYLACLDRIREHFNEIAVTPESISSLHAELYRGEEGAGRYKTTDNVITEIDQWGKPRVRFYPMPASDTAEAMECLCASFSRAIGAGVYDPLLLIPVFVVDFLSIHPFTDGNGKVSRLLQTLLLYQAGYYVNAYVSMEKLIGNSKERYFQSLQYSSIFWNDGTNNYEPFVLYFLEILGEGCREFELRTHYLYGDRKSKPERVREVIDRWPGAVTKRDIMEQCPDIARVTIERALTAMVKEGYIDKTGGGPKTAYIRRRQI